jgi:hypothetical protein
MTDAGKGNPCCLTCRNCSAVCIRQSSCWYTALMSLGMTLIRANTLTFGLIGKDGPHRINKNLFWEYEFGIWKRGRAIGILGIYVWNSRSSVFYSMKSKGLTWSSCLGSVMQYCMVRLARAAAAPMAANQRRPSPKSVWVAAICTNWRSCQSCSYTARPQSVLFPKRSSQKRGSSGRARLVASSVTKV